MMSLTESPATGVAAAALDALGDGVMVVADGRVLLVNQALCRMAGAATTDLLGEAVPPAVLRLAVETTPCVLPNGVPAEVLTVRDGAAQSAREERLQRLASRDGLTGLLNKRTFMR